MQSNLGQWLTQMGYIRPLVLVLIQIISLSFPKVLSLFLFISLSKQWQSSCRSIFFSSSWSWARSTMLKVKPVQVAALVAITSLRTVGFRPPVVWRIKAKVRAIPRSANRKKNCLLISQFMGYGLSLPTLLLNWATVRTVMRYLTLHSWLQFGLR